MPPHRAQSVLRHPLTRILGSSAHVRTLRALFEHGGELSAPSLVDRTGLAKASVAGALRALERLAVIRRIGFGRAILYSASVRHPLAQHLAALFEAEKARFDAILDEFGKIARESHALAAWLYGSVARGEDNPNSDVDVAVVVSTGASIAVREKIRERMAKVGDDSSFHASVMIIDEEDVRRLSAEADPWWISLEEDALVLSGDRPERLTARPKAVRQSSRRDRK